MIDIVFGHKITDDLVIQKRISVGYGFPCHGQIDFITLVEEDILRGTGEVVFATMKWHSPRIFAQRISHDPNRL